MIEVRQTFRAHPGREGEVRDLLTVAAELLQRIGVLDRTVTEEPAGAFVETWRFPVRAAWEATDEVFARDRKLAAVFALLDEVTDSDSADFQVIEDGVSNVVRFRLTEADVFPGTSLAMFDDEEQLGDGDLPTRAEVRAGGEPDFTSL